MLLTLQFLTCPRAQRSESEQELPTHLDFPIGPSDLFVYLQKIHWCHIDRKKGLRYVLF